MSSARQRAPSSWFGGSIHHHLVGPGLIAHPTTPPWGSRIVTRPGI